MTTSDPKTGLPLLGDSQKSVPIPLNLMPELRVLEEARAQSEAAARTLGFQLTLMMGTVAVVGNKALLDDRAWQAMLTKIVAMHGITFDQVMGTDLDKAVVILK